MLQQERKFKLLPVFMVAVFFAALLALLATLIAVNNSHALYYRNIPASPAPHSTPANSELVVLVSNFHKTDSFICYF